MEHASKDRHNPILTGRSQRDAGSNREPTKKRPFDAIRRLDTRPELRMCRVASFLLLSSTLLFSLAVSPSLTPFPGASTGLYRTMAQRINERTNERASERAKQETTFSVRPGAFFSFLTQPVPLPTSSL